MAAIGLWTVWVLVDGWRKMRVGAALMEALAEPEHDAEVRISETTDFHAERSRAKGPRRRKKG